jgi:hypothetical protein
VNLSYTFAKSTYDISLFFSPIDPAIGQLSSDQKYAIYSIDSEKSIKIIFSNKDGSFIPDINSIVSITVFTTSGSAISTSIASSYGYNLSNTKIRSVAATVSFEGAVGGGSDSPDINTLKAKIINEISTRNIILTEDDLNNYFALLVSQW